MKIVFATNNPNKIKEVQAQLPNHIQLVSLETIGCHEDIPANRVEMKQSIMAGLVQEVLKLSSATFV